MASEDPHESGHDLRAWFAAAPAATLPPPLGWIRTVRASVGMTQQELARRLGITPQSAFRLETNERNGTIRIDSLRRVANALDCDVVYALVPRPASGPPRRAAVPRAHSKAGQRDAKGPQVTDSGPQLGVDGTAGIRPRPRPAPPTGTPDGTAPTGAPAAGRPRPAPRPS